MKILFLAHRIPFPPDKGDKIRSYHQIRYLSKKHDIYLATTLDEQSDRKYVNGLRKYCKQIIAIHLNRKISLLRSMLTTPSFSVASFYDPELQKYVDAIIEKEKIDTIFCFCSSMAEYVFRSRFYRDNKLPGVKLIMDFVDLDSDKWAQYATYTRYPINLIFKLENSRLFRYECEINRLFDYSIFVSDREERIFKNEHPAMQNVHVIPNGVDSQYFTPKLQELIKCDTNQSQSTDQWIDGEIKYDSPYKKNKPILLFTGIMNYFANEDGVRWFCDTILPKIKQKIPEVEFYIVGNKPTRIVRKLSMLKGVNVTGYVEDIRPYYWYADVCVIPLRIARGLQNKVLEAMATGNAVIATSNASDGITCRNGEDIIIADQVDDFAQRTVEVIKNAEERRRLGKNAVVNITENYSWERNFKVFDRLL